MFAPGDPVPSFYARSATNPRYSFDSVAGRYIVLSFLGSCKVAGVAEFCSQLYADTQFFDDAFASAFIVSNDPHDERDALLVERYPGIRVFWDQDFALTDMFGCRQASQATESRISLMTWILDPGLRVLRVIPITNLATHYEEVCKALAGLSSPADNVQGWAPVLLVPNVLEPELCRELIAYCESRGTDESGFMRTDGQSGKTVMVVDHNHKRRSDCAIEDERLQIALRSRVVRRLVPQVERAFQFKASRMERYIVACYDTSTGGYFRPHKDNTTLGTAHRRFAVSIGLDDRSYEGGDLRFPEYGRRVYRPPTGGAIVFSCSILHEVTPMTQGKRYVVLPFLYDEAAAEVRLKNAAYLQDEALRNNVIASVAPSTR